MHRLLMVIAVSLVSTTAVAGKAVIEPPPLPTITPEACKREGVQITLQHEYRADSMEELLKKYNADKQAVQDYAKKLGVTAKIKSENYNVNMQSDSQMREDGLAYRLTGNSMYVVDPKDKGKDLFGMLMSNKIRGSMNYNMNDNCSGN